MKPLITLWRFSRPHTIIGSTLSILSIFAIAAATTRYPQIESALLLLSLLAALACNVYITGLNQWSDVEVDRINKPWLPIPAGNLQKNDAMKIVVISGVVAVASAACLSVFFSGLIVLIMMIGTAYSLPPLKFKRNHFWAAGAITVVRGLLVNLGFYLHFRHEMSGEWTLATAIWPLTIFVVLFSLGIAWFKDIPDTEGDAVHAFGTLAVQRGRKQAFRSGVGVVSLGYAVVIFAACLGYLPLAYFVAMHLLGLTIFIWQAMRLNVSDNKQVKRFYFLFWGLFFLEYALYPLGLF